MGYHINRYTPTQIERLAKEIYNSSFYEDRLDYSTEDLKLMYGLDNQTQAVILQNRLHEQNKERAFNTF